MRNAHKYLVEEHKTPYGESGVNRKVKQPHYRPG
jgi:hypothetical protein